MNILYWLIKSWLAISNQRPGSVQGLGGWAFGREIYQPQTPTDKKQRKVLKVLIGFQCRFCLVWTPLRPSELSGSWSLHEGELVGPMLVCFPVNLILWTLKCWYFWSFLQCEIFLHIVVEEIPGWGALWLLAGLELIPVKPPELPENDSAFYCSRCY